MDYLAIIQFEIGSPQFFSIIDFIIWITKTIHSHTKVDTHETPNPPPHHPAPPLRIHHPYHIIRWQLRHRTYIRAERLVTPFQGNPSLSWIGTDADGA